MKKHKKVIRAHKVRSAKPRNIFDRYLIVVRSWMLFVLFALMLGVGAIVGNFINQKLNETTPQVAGIQIEAR